MSLDVVSDVGCAFYVLDSPSQWFNNLLLHLHRVPLLDLLSSTYDLDMHESKNRQQFKSFTPSRCCVRQLRADKEHFILYLHAELQVVQSNNPVDAKGRPGRCSVTRGRGQPEGLKKFSAPTYIGPSTPFFSLLK